MESKPSIDEGVTGKKSAPPSVITVDATNRDSTSAATPTKGYDTASQARTPKHANKSREEEESNDVLRKHDADHQFSQPSRLSANQGWFPSSKPHYQPQSGYNIPYDSRIPNTQGAFQIRERPTYPSHQQQQPPMQVSPGSGRYYYNNGPRAYGGGPGGYGDRYGGHNEYPPPPSHGYHQQPTRGYGPPPMYPPQQQQYANPGYEVPPPPPVPSGPWGPPQPSFASHGRPPPHPNAITNQDPYIRGPPPIAHNHPGNNQNTFSRAVSSSFDRSIRSSDMKSNLGYEESIHQETHQPPPDRDSASLEDDASWGALKQVHSVDEEEMRKRLQKRRNVEANKEVAVLQPESNSSSLTNSPTEGIVAKKPVDEEREPSKRTSSLDSLSSVASAQEPMTTQPAVKQPLSPGDSAESLDLMKCPSGSSALLMPSHQRSLSHFSLSELDNSNKRPLHSEEREDGETEHPDIEETRKDSFDAPIAKKGRVESSEKKASPLSISCSPPLSPSNRKTERKLHKPHAIHSKRKQLEESPAYYDKPSQATYGMDSMPPIPGEGHLAENHASIPPRPGSSASSTITPMNVEQHDTRHHPGVSLVPSWEIQAQDSFGAGSTGQGTTLMGSFSFQQDYPMLSASASGDLQTQSHHQMQQSLPHLNQNVPMESRNQSFDGGHYHTSFGRSDSMMSYESRQGAAPYDNRQGYQGQFPPHAPSWGSAGSYQPAYGQHRVYPAMMRNYSEDSGARASPPPGPGVMRVMPPNFPPPPEFRAPPSMVSKTVTQNTIMTSPYQPSPKVGPYGWSKDEDDRLTDIMKKFKNPRDWEPIAKEHGRGRTAKECHERWIRYLKPGVRKGQWTDHEDAIVMEAVSTSSEQPFTRWSDLAQRLPGRVGKQIRDRWVNHLNPSINHLPFSREDDLLLWEGHKKLGKRWVEISTKYFNNSRSENHIKNRWYSASFKKFITNQFGAEAYSGGKSMKKESPSKKRASSPKRQKDLDYLSDSV
jgi:Myb-like DNA-binding domain